MWDAAHIWLDIGIDSVRLDAIGAIYEDPQMTSHDIPMNLAELRRSLLNYCRELLQFRKSTPALIAGDYIPLSKEADECFAFLRETNNQSWWY